MVTALPPSTRGTEPGKTRPVLVVQSQAAEPLRIRVAAAGKLRRDSDLLIDQLRSIDNERLIQGPLCQLTQPVMSQVEIAIREVLDMDELSTRVLKNDDTH